MIPNNFILSFSYSYVSLSEEDEDDDSSCSDESGIMIKKKNHMINLENKVVPG